MKYIVYLIICFSLLINTCLAKQEIEVNNKLISFNQIDNFNLQSFTIAKNNLSIVLVGNEDKDSIIKVYNLDTLKEIKSFKFQSLGHANGITYNSKTNKIYVLGSGGDDTIFSFDGSTFEYIDSFKINIPARSITYVEDEDIYLVRSFINGYILNNKFEYNIKYPFIIGLNANSNVARQDWTYYNKYLYYATWSWIRLGGDGSNKIYVYDLNGKFIDSLYINNSIGEIEDIGFYNNKMILGFNGYDDNINFYFEDIVNFKEKEIVEEVKDNKKPSYIKYIIGSISILVIVSIIFILKKKKKL